MKANRIEVVGSARRSVAPDRLLWSLVMSESGESPADTFARAGKRLDALTHGLRDALGDGAEIHTGALSVRPKLDKHGRPLTTVDVTGQVTVAVPVADAGRAAAAAMAAGAEQLRGPALEVRDRDTVAEGLLEEAVAAARRKAEVIAKAAGRPLGGVLSVAEEETERLYPMARTAAFRADAGPELAPADEEVAVAVRVVFALEE
jgi:uncharacterized protein